MISCLVVSQKVQHMVIMTHPHLLQKDIGGSWNLWRNLAKQSPEFGNPESFIKIYQIKVGSSQQR